MKDLVRFALQPRSAQDPQPSASNLLQLSLTFVSLAARARAVPLLATPFPSSSVFFLSFHSLVPSLLSQLHTGRVPSIYFRSTDGQHQTESSDGDGVKGRRIDGLFVDPPHFLPNPFPLSSPFPLSPLIAYLLVSRTI
jgi:hypothetical protein